jgi:transcriptional regulator with XRE-family HTH domain
MTIQEGIGKRIRSLREFNKLSQTELAVKVGYKDKTSIAKIEAGKVDLPQSKIFAFAKNLGTTPSYILGDNESPNYMEEKCSFINDNDKAILDKYHQLNDKGKQRLLERADELIELGYVAKGDELKEA